MDYSSLFDYSVDPSSLVAAAAGGALGWNAVTIQEGMRKSLVHFDDISKFLAANRAVEPANLTWLELETITPVYSRYKKT
ncbi:hypothetical protein M8J77_011330 [Diaphorina citri]|nr:hypothetical protein M8J77_011330 [Diaphorina citri]